MAVLPLSFGQKLPGSGGGYLRVKEKGDQVQFKIAQEPVYEGKHFSQQGDSWTVTECPRIASEGDCETCEQYFTIMGKIKKLKMADKSLTDESPEIKPLKQESRPLSVSIQFYFPVLDRADGKFKILQTTNGVRNKFNEQFEAGIDVMNTEWILRNTGSVNPNGRYMITAVDSANVKKLSPEEKEEFEKAKAYDMSSVGKSSKSDEESDEELTSGL